MKFSPLAILLLLCSPLYAVEPRAVISGPKHAKPGTLVVLSSVGSVSDPGGLAWVFIDGKTQALEGLNNELGFVQGEVGKVIVGLVAAGTVEGTSKPKIVVSKWTVEINDGPAPEPGPEPVPPPIPPPLPDGQYGFAKVAYNSAMLVPQPQRAKAAVLASAFDSTAAAIGAGTLGTWDLAMNATRDANNLALGADKPAWEGVRKAINDYTAQLYASKKLVNVADIATAWREIATGLRQVR